MLSFLDRFWSHVDVKSPDECWPWTGARLQSGYGHIQLIGVSTTAHRVMLEITSGMELAADQHSAHSCDNPPCCNPKHLFPATGSENQLDAIRKGRWAHIDRSIGRHRILTVDQVREIRAITEPLPKGRYSKRGQIYRELSAKYGVASRTIYKVAAGISWKTITQPQQEAPNARTR